MIICHLNGYPLFVRALLERTRTISEPSPKEGNKSISLAELTPFANPSEQLSRGQLSEMLGPNFWETEAFVKRHGANLH